MLRSRLTTSRWAIQLAAIENCCAAAPTSDIQRDTSLRASFWVNGFVQIYCVRGRADALRHPLSANTPMRRPQGGAPSTPRDLHNQEATIPCDESGRAHLLPSRLLVSGAGDLRLDPATRISRDPRATTAPELPALSVDPGAPDPRLLRDVPGLRRRPDFPAPAARSLRRPIRSSLATPTARAAGAALSSATS